MLSRLWVADNLHIENIDFYIFSFNDIDPPADVYKILSFVFSIDSARVFGIEIVDVSFGVREAWNKKARVV